MLIKAYSPLLGPLECPGLNAGLLGHASASLVTGNQFSHHIFLVKHSEPNGDALLFLTGSLFPPPKHFH